MLRRQNVALRRSGDSSVEASNGLPALTIASRSAPGRNGNRSHRPAEVVYDITRLVTRALNPSPNGIDRVDFAFARHFLSAPQNHSAAFICTCLGQGLAAAEGAMRSIDGIETYWNEFVDARDDSIYESVVSVLCGASKRDAHEARIKRGFGANLISENWQALRQWAFFRGQPLTEAREGAIYFNASQFLLDKAWYLRWLDRRKDVKAVFFVHDLLPIDFPEFFWPGEPESHERRMRNICRLGAGVIVGTQAVARRLEAFAAEQGRRNLAICVARPPVADIFETSEPPDGRLVALNYFVVCGTIEPRKNHLMLLNIWRELASRGPAPKLVVVGKRGWLCQNVLDVLDRSDALRAHVIEAGGLSTPGLRRLLAGARALLAPSFAEGFGIPVAEAIAAGAPVIASEIEVFREIGGDALDYIDPLDGVGWLRAIEDYARPDSTRRAEAVARLAQVRCASQDEFGSKVDEFLSGIAALGHD